MGARHPFKPLSITGFLSGAWHHLKTVGAQGGNCRARHRMLNSNIKTKKTNISVDICVRF